jgi:uridine kinase
MIVEGILILANPELRDLFDVKIYVHMVLTKADSPYERDIAEGDAIWTNG